MKRLKILFALALCFGLPSCTYLKHAAIQSNYSRIQKASPSQVNLKHMLDRDMYFVYGKTTANTHHFVDLPMAIAAYSSKYRENERVDTMYFIGTETHYGLNLPAGDYRLLVYADGNKNQLYENTEVVAIKEINLDSYQAQEKVVGHIDISLGDYERVDWAENIRVPDQETVKQSLYYPTGTIRELKDSIFDASVATLGMYDPTSFLECAPTMFYALEEEISYKIPVVFVHGVDGSPRQFETIINQLDSTLYKPWFFYYPSGADLDQLADFFYDIFLSGKVIPLGEMPMIVVAHSMGGLIVRSAINRYQSKSDENKVALFISIATPFGGHPAAAAGEEKGIIVLPAWRDLNPNSRFIDSLYSPPLPQFIEHQLYYAYRNTSAVKLGQNSDGVVPLSSQLDTRAQSQSSEQFGFNSNHVEILRNQDMIDLLLKNVAEVKNVFPQSHLEVLNQGGFVVDFGDKFSPQARHTVNTLGRYMVALAKGTITPINKYQEKFVRVANGEERATTEVEKIYLYVEKNYPAVTQQ